MTFCSTRKPAPRGRALSCKEVLSPDWPAKPTASIARDRPAATTRHPFNSTKPNPAPAVHARQTSHFRTKLVSIHLKNQPLTIAGREFSSRLILGTGKFCSPGLPED
jgi:hypothetical protein